MVWRVLGEGMRMVLDGSVRGVGVRVLDGSVRVVGVATVSPQLSF